MNSKTQSVTIKTNSPETEVYKEGEKVGEGDSVKVGMLKDRKGKQFVLKQEGYKNEYRVIGQDKNSPWKIANILNAFMFYTLDVGNKSKDYRNQFDYNFNSPIQERTKEQKFILLNETVFDLDKKDFRFSYQSISDYYDGDVLDDDDYYKQTEKELKFKDKALTNAMNKVLKKYKYIDTTQKVITTNNNSLNINATVKQVYVTNVTYGSWASFFTAKTKIEWEILNAYEEEQYSTTIESQSGEFDEYYYDNARQRTIKDAIHEGFFKLLEKSKVQSLLEKEEDTKKRFDGAITLNTGEVPTTLPEAQEATLTINNKEGHGSGVVVGKDGYILTNYHVGSQEDIKISLEDGKKLEPEMVRYHKPADLCLLKVDHHFDKTFKLSDSSDAYKTGQTVFTIGTPASKQLGQTLSKGIISGVRESEQRKLIQTDASVNPGSSGGALTSENGNLIGIVNEKIMGIGIEGIGFSIPVDRAKDILSLETNFSN